MELYLFLVITCCLQSVSADTASRFVAPGFDRETDLVLTSSEEAELRRLKRQAELPDSEPTITSYHIISTVTARYVSTSVITTVENNADLSQEVQFGFRFNPEAFISGFVMIVDEIAYEAQVREKVAAQKAYNEAKRRGQSAAQVRQIDKSTSRFSVDLNLEPKKTVIFNLTYQELLRRDEGQFIHGLNVEPGQIVEDLRVEVNIIEPQGISSVEARWTPHDDSLTPLVSFTPLSTRASVLFTPSTSLQSSAGAEGLVGAIEVTYDVQHDLTGGDIQIVNGYFVHYISPEGIPPAPKKVVFVIDVSGSMSGQKIDQTREVMIEILSQLREIDYFNVLAFSQGVSNWRQSVVQATPSNVANAQTFVRNLQAGGGTNINSALVAAARQVDETDEAFPAMFLLTDGRPTWGVTSTQAILDAVKEETEEKVALFCIGFGTDVDDQFMERLGSENQGLYRKIYVDSDAPLQMRKFFDEFATPLLYNIAVQYQDDAVETNTLIGGDFISYFDGKELVVAGKLSEGFMGTKLNAVVTAKGRDRDFELEVTQEVEEELDPNMVEDFSQRMWAFLTIKDLLAREKLSSVPEEKAALKERALALSLKYSFVTPLTSLLIIKPPETTPTAPPPTTANPPTAIPLDNSLDLRRLQTSQNWVARLIYQVDRTTPASPLIHELHWLPDSAAASSAPKLDPSRLPVASGSGSVGGDPHIVIDVPHSNLTICFDLQPSNGTIISLLSDPQLGIYVNAEIVERRLSGQNQDHAPSRHPSYLGRIGIVLHDYRVLITDEAIMIDSEIKLSWSERRSVVIRDFNITVYGTNNLTVAIGGVIHMKVCFWNSARTDQKHLNFEVVNSDRFSPEVGGVVGQFQYKQLFLKNPNHGLTANNHTRGVMEIDGKDRFVVMQKERVERVYDCWWSKSKSYIGDDTQYFVTGLFSDSK